jgi:hypothetical protein
LSSPIDPFRPFRPRADDAEAWLQLWPQATRWWVAPVVGGREVFTAKEQLLVELIDGLRGRFEGRQIELALGGERSSSRFDCVTASGITVIGSMAIGPLVAWREDPADIRAPSLLADEHRATPGWCFAHRDAAEG